MKRMLGATALFTLLGAPLAAHAAMSQLTDLFVFGDSLSDGGNSGLASQAVTGGTVVFPPPPYAGGRYSNGPTAVEYLWQSFNPGDDSFKPSLAGGTNYAIGGATTGSASFNGVNPGVPAGLQPVYSSLSNSWQLQTFASQVPSFDPATSLFVVYLFPNDLFYQTATGNLPGTYFGGVPTPGDPLNPAMLIANGINNIVGTISFLALNGAQNFLVPNLVDIGKTPEFLSDPGTSAALSALSVAFNQNLAPALTQLDALLPKVDIVQFDTAGFLKNVSDNPAAYGLKNVDSACLSGLTVKAECNPDAWAFWDGVHPTTKVHSLLGGEFYAAVVPEPQTYALMALGLGAVGWAARRRKTAA